jgi:hypothetical protein
MSANSLKYVRLEVCVQNRSINHNVSLKCRKTVRLWWMACGVQSLLPNFMDAAIQAASSLVCNLIPIDCWFKFGVAAWDIVDQ